MYVYIYIVIKPYTTVYCFRIDNSNNIFLKFRRDRFLVFGLYVNIATDFYRVQGRSVEFVGIDSRRFFCLIKSYLEERYSATVLSPVTEIEAGVPRGAVIADQSTHLLTLS